MAEIDLNSLQLPEDNASLRSLVRTLLLEREQQKQYVDQHKRRAEEGARGIALGEDYSAEETDDDARDQREFDG